MEAVATFFSIALSATSNQPPEKEDSLATRLVRMTPQKRARCKLELAERVRRRLIEAGVIVEYEAEPEK